MYHEWRNAMRVITGRNVNELFALGMDLLAHEGQRVESRAGPVIVMPCPVISVYERPTERVLFSPTRDANPFFHLFEGLWMLAGRRDAASLDHYVKDFGERFAEPDGNVHGAYGHRWREAFGHDQLGVTVAKLRSNPGDRQCVLQMWDARVSGHDDLLGAWKDRPCNTHVYFWVRGARTDHRPDGLEISKSEQVLDMTVCCRSNDIVMGAYGANAVHFSMLMEYVAGRVGVGVGTMYQISNNYHGYVRDLDRIGDPRLLLYAEETQYIPAKTFPMGENWDAWDTDLENFMEWHDDLWTLPNDSDEIDLPDGLRNTWFHVVAGYACQANWLRRHGRMPEALNVADRIEADDWHQACRAWLLRRKGVQT